MEIDSGCTVRSHQAVRHTAFYASARLVSTWFALGSHIREMFIPGICRRPAPSGWKTEASSEHRWSSRQERHRT